MNNALTLFLIFSTLMAMPLFLLIRDLISLYRLPPDVTTFFGTSQLSPSFSLVDLYSERVLEEKYGSSQWVKLSNDTMTSTSVELQGAAATLVDQKIPFEIRIGRGKWNSYYFGTEEMIAPGPKIDTTNYDNEELGHRKSHIFSIKLESGNSPIAVHGLRLREIFLDGRYEGSVHIVNCKIHKLHLSSSPSKTERHIWIENSWINLLQLESNSAGDLNISGGGVKNIVCPEPSAPPPFQGDVKFIDDPQFLCLGGAGRIGGEQNIRNLRTHLQKLDNIDAERYIFAFEKRYERRKERKFLKFVSIIYDTFSAYGSRPSRAFIWFLGVYIFTFVLILSSNGAAIPEICSDSPPSNWMGSLCNKGIKGEVTRSLLLSSQSTFNPFSIFTERNLVQPMYVWINFWSLFHSLISIFLLGLVFFGIRRKFKSE